VYGGVSSGGQGGSLPTAKPVVQRAEQPPPHGSMTCTALLALGSSTFTPSEGVEGSRAPPNHNQVSYVTRASPSPAWLFADESSGKDISSHFQSQKSLSWPICSRINTRPDFRRQSSYPAPPYPTPPHRSPPRLHPPFLLAPCFVCCVVMLLRLPPLLQ